MKPAPQDLKLVHAFACISPVCIKSTKVHEIYPSHSFELNLALVHDLPFWAFHFEVYIRRMTEPLVLQVISQELEVDVQGQEKHAQSLQDKSHLNDASDKFQNR